MSMSIPGKRSVSQSFLYGQPVTEWSTPPPLAEKTSDLNSEMGKLKLDLGIVSRVSQKKSVNQTAPDATPPTHISSHPTNLLFATKSTNNTSLSEGFAPSSGHHSTKLTPWSPEYTQSLVPPKQRCKASNVASIPTALVTPLPGTSPPQQTSEFRTCDGQTQRGNVDVYEEDEKSRGWRDIREGEHELSGTLVVPGDNAVELIEKWKALIDTKDNIMKQKNIQIERQKTTISKLQQDARELETKLHKQMIAQFRGHGASALEARLQALEAENSSIRAQLAEAISSRNIELHTLSSKLDHKEYEMHRAMKDHEQSSEGCHRQVLTLQAEVCKQEEHIRKLEQQLAGYEAANKHHIEHIDQLNEYMGNMPSMEEHRGLKMQSRELQMQCDRLTKWLEEREIDLKNTLDKINAKDVLVCSLKGVKTELENTRLKLESHKQSLAVLEPENKKLKQECHHLQKVVVEAERRCRHELQAMRERHRARFMEATAKLRSQYKNLAKRARALESQLTRNSDAMMALNDELQCSQGTIGVLKTSVKDLVSENQGLLGKNLTLQELTTEAMKVSSSLTEAQSSAAQQLTVELSQCVEELESLVSLSMSLADGQEPTSAMLFGPDGHVTSSGMEMSVDCGLEVRLDQVKHLRAKIEDLRTVISEHFAAQLSSVCHVQ